MFTASKVHVGEVLHSLALNEIDMSHSFKHSQHPHRNILWHVKPIPASPQATGRDQEGASLLRSARDGSREVL